MSLDCGRRKDAYRVEKEIVPLHSHTLGLAEIENLLETQVERSHEIVAVDAEYASLHWVELDQAVGRD